MSQIDELESRITAALDRIGQGVGVMADRQGGDPQELDALRQALEDEKLANAQLEERVRAIKDRQDRDLGALESRLEDTRTAMSQLDAELQKLKEVNRQLRENNDALRAANAEGVGEPHLINSGLRSEVDALRAERAVEAAEAQAVLSAIEPLLDAAESQGESA